jgi:stage II sporulation protein D
MFALALHASLFFAAPEASIRVRVARHSGGVSIAGPLNCGTKKTGTHRFKRRGAELAADGQRVRTGKCAGQGSFNYQGLRWNGRVEVRVHRGAVIVVAHVALERYVAGVVSAELPAGWPPAALEAMAVAARSYALFRAGQARKKPYDVTADANSQVFRGDSATRRPARRAAAATAGQVLRSGGKPAAAYFHACAAGRTATAAEVWGGKDLPYLQSVISPDLACNRINWNETLAASVAGKKLGVGRLIALSTKGYTPSGRVAKVAAVGDRGEREYTVQELRKRLGWGVVRSADFTARVSAGKLVVSGHGSGHGVGMSQWGARGMALRGETAAAILAHYYPGAILQ